jgi:hypothetical protein
LAAKGLGPGEPIAEDWGWCVPLESKPHRLFVGCASVDDTPDTWRVFVSAEGGILARIFGKDKSAESVAAAFAAVKEILQQDPGVRNLKEDGD